MLYIFDIFYMLKKTCLSLLEFVEVWIKCKYENNEERNLLNHGNSANYVFALASLPFFQSKSWIIRIENLIPTIVSLLVYMLNLYV